ncbi:MAG: cobalt-precorrin-5B (C(1))-methyltransferase CbiD [Eubacterium sp.]|nr:cobalt-precorrin-5B (C(1))-methyltransferase CbiD [Eubacterium sp.]
MRTGFTTGSCAAAAAKAAAWMLLTDQKKEKIKVMTPAGIPYEAKLLDLEITKRSVSCSVRKDGGDDPDVTTGLHITARVERIGDNRSVGEDTCDDRKPGNGEMDAGNSHDRNGKGKTAASRVIIHGGEGVGTVTQPGLDQPVGEAAINHVPREMIIREVTEVMDILDEPGPLSVTISVPGGEEIAKKTFNPRLGIVGGISIIGTSGIVEPMSEKALTDTIRLELRQRFRQGQRIAVATPGNYGMDMLRNAYDYDLDRAVKCSNFIGDTIDMASEEGYDRMVLLGHMGKLVKCAGGAMNTHSRYGDRRMELLAKAAERVMAEKARAGKDPGTSVTGESDIDDKVIERIRGCVSTEAALALLTEEQAKEVSRVILDLALDHLRKKADGRIAIEMIIYTNVQGILAESEHAVMWLAESGDFNGYE